MLQLFSWWYGRGWRLAWTDIQKRLIGVAHAFSVPILLQTLWAPWRRIVTVPGAGLDAKVRAMGDNLVSRCIGFTVRTLVLLTAGLLLAVTLVISLTIVVIWPFIPAAILALIVIGILG